MKKGINSNVGRHLFIKPTRFNGEIFLSCFVLSALVLLLSACQSTQHSSVFQLVDATSSPISTTDIDFSWLEGIESVNIDWFLCGLMMETRSQSLLAVRKYT